MTSIDKNRHMALCSETKTKTTPNIGVLKPILKHNYLTETYHVFENKYTNIYHTKNITVECKMF